MNSQQSITNLLKRLWHHINHRRRQQFSLLLVLILMTSFAEVLSIGAVLPFLAVLTSPERVFEMQVAQPVILALKLNDPKQLIMPLTIVFGLAALISGGMRLLLLWASTRLSFAAGADLSISIYRRTLYQPYSVHYARNSSEIIDGISNKAKGVIVVINMTLTLLSSSIMLAAIIFTLFVLNPIIAITAFGGFGLIYFVITRITRKKLLINSQIIARESNQLIKSLQEGLGGIRDILIDGSQEVYCNIYQKADIALRYATGNNSFISSSPRYAMEALGMFFIALLAYFLAQQSDGIAKAIPFLGLLALASQRLLPVLQQAYNAWSSILGWHASFQDTLDLLDQALPEYADEPMAYPIPFHYDIKFRQLSFRYNQEAPAVLNNLNLIIVKGSRIGIIGETGSGKSTLLDILMGLLQPSEGFLEIDNQVISLSNSRAWQAHIAHVPQAIFLADSTIEENIAFGVPKDQIDIHRVRQAANQAQIAENIESWPEKYQTFVGERGIRLSGGQRQRIGIARALYKQADVIVFDEATSALDNETEEAVMEAIESLSKDLTLIIIAHRTTTLKNCTQIIELSNGSIRRVGRYQEIFN